MKTRFKLYLLTFFLFVLLFVLQKPLFMLRYLGIYKECPLLDWLKVMWHGLPLDFSVAGYLTIIPFSTFSRHPKTPLRVSACGPSLAVSWRFCC